MLQLCQVWSQGRLKISQSISRVPHIYYGYTPVYAINSLEISLKTVQKIIAMEASWRGQTIVWI